MDYILIGNCVSLSGDFITEMKDNSETIFYEDFVEYVSEKEIRAIFPDYDWHGEGGLEFRDDYAIGFYQSKYNGVPCVYFSHSAIEYVWIKRR